MTSLNIRPIDVKGHLSTFEVEEGHNHIEVIYFSIVSTGECWEHSQGGNLAGRGKNFREIDSFGLLVSFDHQSDLDTVGAKDEVYCSSTML